LSKYTYLSKEDTYELIYKAQNDENEAKEQLVQLNTGLVKNIALRFAAMGYEVEDLIQIGYIGLLKAIERFEPERGFMFSTYAVPLILGEIKRYIRDDGKIKIGRQIKQEIREMRKVQEEYYNRKGYYPKISELAEIMKIEKTRILELLEAQEALIGMASIDDEDNPVFESNSYEKAYEEENKKLNLIYLKEALGELAEKERKVIILRYFKDLTQAQTAKLIGISQVQVSRIEKRVLSQLKLRLLLI